MTKKVGVLTPSQKVKVIEFLLSMGDYNEEANTRESKLLNSIYRVIHPSKKCRHWEWEKEAEGLLKEIK